MPCPLAQPVPSWPAVSCGGGPAPRQALCSVARLGLLPDQPALGLSLGFPLCSPCAQCLRRPVPPPCLRSSRHPDPPGVPSWGQENDRSPRAGALPPPAGWPLSHCFHRSRLRFPAPLPSPPSLILVTVQLAQGRAAKRAGPPLHLCALPAQQPLPPFWAQGLGASPPPSTCAGWGGNHAFGRLSMARSLPAHSGWVLRGESPLFNGWVCLLITVSALSRYCRPKLHCLAWEVSGLIRAFPSSPRPA